jgi:RNase P subunit RPR2
MLRNRILFGKRSHCHRTQSILVRSRSGGFVTQNCLECGRPHRLPLNDLPALLCDTCHHPLVPCVKEDKNYWYVCLSCGSEFRLPDLVPDWREHFPHWGIGTTRNS